MKKSIKYLPRKKQRDLQVLTHIIRETVKECEMIILFGSYARNDYVEFDEREEYGVRTIFMSDYDILIVTRRKSSPVISGTVLSKVKEKYYRHKDRESNLYTTPQLIAESITCLNREIDRGAYFYTDIKREGVMLYDSGNYKLARRRKLNFREIHEMAKFYYNDKYPYAAEFINISRSELDSKLEKIKYRMAAFQLHQAAENFFHTITLVFIIYGYKCHDLEELMEKCKRHTTEIFEAFPRDTKEEERLFELLRESYIQARYNPNFVVTREDLEALIPKVELLGSIVERVCQQRFNYYLEMAGQSTAPKTKG